MLNRFIIGLILVLFTSTTFGQTDKKGFFQGVKHQVIFGYNLGAIAPLSFPNTIRKIVSYSPLFTPTIGYEGTYEISPKWRLGAGLRFESKGMKVVDSVQYFHTMIKVEGDNPGEDVSFEGDFTGMNKTIAKTSYLTLPIFSEYRFEKWNVRAGIYVSYLLSGNFHGEVYDGYIRKGDSLGEKVIVKQASFDFASEIKEWDWGVNLGASRRLNKRWEVYGLGQLGLEPIFSESFRGVGYSLHQMFVTLGGRYSIKY